MKRYYNVIIVGGEKTGVCAAIAAARSETAEKAAAIGACKKRNLRNIEN